MDRERIGRSHAYSSAFREDALRYVERNRISYARAARELGVSTFSLRAWARTVEGEPMGPKKTRKRSDALPTSEAMELEQLRREKRALEKRVAVLEEEREILKKAAAFFAKESE